MENLPYDEFLDRRRDAIAKVIHRAFDRLRGSADSRGVPFVPERLPSVRELIAEEESATLEFKSSMFYSYNPDVPEKVITGAVVKTIAGFLNTGGGTLVIGVADKKDVVGIATDFAAKKLDRDRFDSVQ